MPGHGEGWVAKAVATGGTVHGMCGSSSAEQISRGSVVATLPISDEDALVKASWWSTGRISCCFREVTVLSQSFGEVPLLAP